MSERNSNHQRTPEQIQKIENLRRNLEQSDNGYLILTRLENQAVVLEPGILIRILIAQDGRASIGISAPREMLVLREELVYEDHRGTTTT